MPSFDIVSKADTQEVRNAVQQVLRELETRYDFRGSKSNLELKEDKLIVVIADDQMKLQSIQDLIRQKMAKRGVSPKSLTFQTPEPAASNTIRQHIDVKQGLTDDELKEMNKAIKTLGLKITTQIQGEQLRVTGKKKDDLQAAMAVLRTRMTALDLQFVNFRD